MARSKVKLANPTCEEVKYEAKRFPKLFREGLEAVRSAWGYADSALISVVAILVLKGIGTSVNSKLSNVNGNLQ
jgi:hypothetical protein